MGEDIKIRNLVKEGSEKKGNSSKAQLVPQLVTHNTTSPRDAKLIGVDEKVHGGEGSEQQNLARRRREIAVGKRMLTKSFNLSASKPVSDPISDSQILYMNRASIRAEAH